MPRLVPAFASLLLFSVVSPAAAQIYSWLDAGGVQIYSDRPRPDRGDMVVTYAVAGRDRVRATNPAAPRAASRFDDIIERHAAASGVSADLIRAVIQVESGFNPEAVSPKGALGLMQLMPATARELGVADPLEPEDNIRGGVAYLKELLGHYAQDVRLALAAYNAGPVAVARYGGVPPYRETQAYVKKVTASSPLGTLASPARAGSPAMYKWIEMVNGRPVPRYSNLPPTGQVFELVGRR